MEHARFTGEGPVRDDVPPASKEDVELYVRTYTTVLRTSGDVPLHAFVAAHLGVHSSLHHYAASSRPDLGALIYAANRLPAEAAKVARIVCAQLPEQFSRAIPGGIESWSRVSAPGRRRQWHYDGQATLSIHVASHSDLDDVVPTLVAYQIEWNKLHHLLRADPAIYALLHQPESPGIFEGVGRLIGAAADDWARLGRIWDRDGGAWNVLRQIGTAEKQFSIRLLGGPQVGYAKVMRRWWGPIGEEIDRRELAGRPVYFVSSNLHSLVNLVSGYARRRREILWKFLDEFAADREVSELRRIRDDAEEVNEENVLYYAARLWGRLRASSSEQDEREHEELERGIYFLPPSAGVDVGAHLIDLARLQPGDLDPRLADCADALCQPGNFNAPVILNVDYPLGLAAYHLLRQIAEAVDDLRGVYLLGKAATLNGAVGDVLISDVVRDEHSGNTYIFDNAFDYGAVAPFLERGAAFDHQKAVTVKGTFLQNRAYLDFFYREAYTVVEMESGPYLSAIFEATNPARFPLNEVVAIRDLTFDFGLVHYASDTPYTRARTLGGRSLSFEGVDSTYGASIAILRRIAAIERQQTGGDTSTHLDGSRGSG